MKSLQIYLFLFLSVFALGACIQNDIPYPYIKGEITAFEVEGQTGDAEINKNSRTIVVEVGDGVDRRITYYQVCCERRGHLQRRRTILRQPQ